ncbi:MAG: DUF2628 domain-containing protein [Aestuariivirga sp.]
MAIYSVHGDPSKPEDAVFVREGFSFAAFIFQPFWALWNRMWVTAAILFAIGISISTLNFSSTVQSLTSLMIALIFGAIANDLRRRTLSLKGKEDLGLVSGDSFEEAELRFYLSGPSQPAVQAALAPDVPRPAPGHEPLGLFG